MNLRQLEAFRAAVSTGSFTGAAELLHTSQPSVSRLVADLERSTGLKLFARRGSRIYLTPEAEAFFQHVERSFTGLSDLRTAAREIGALREGALKIAAFPAASLRLVPDTVAAFAQHAPGVRLTLHIRSSRRVQELIASGGYDIGIATIPFEYPGLKARWRVSASCLCALPQTHPLAAGSTVRLQDLAQEPWLALDPSFAASRHIAYVFQSLGMTANTLFETNLSYASCELVERGAGIAVIDPLTAAAYRNRRVAIRPTDPPIPFQFAVTTPEARIPSRALEVFSEQLKAELTRMGLRIGADPPPGGEPS